MLYINNNIREIKYDIPLWSDCISYLIKSDQTSYNFNYRGNKMKKLTQEEAILKLQQTHPQYDFSETIYSGSHKKIKFICINHGSKEALYSNLVKGQGCNQCRSGQNYNKLDPYEAIVKIQEIHPNYNFSNSVYTKYNEKITYQCNVHGTTSQVYASLIKGQGCNQCGYIKQSTTTTKESSERIDILKDIHQSYCFEKSIYTGAHNLIEFICPTHGKMYMRYSNMKNGSGCKKCYYNKSNYDIYRNKPTFLYLILINDIQYKIGLCRQYNNEDFLKSLKRRYTKEYKINIDIKVLKYRLYLDGYEAYKLEVKVKNKWRDNLINISERILLSGHTETFIRSKL